MYFAVKPTENIWQIDIVAIAHFKMKYIYLVNER